jgi:hypothetical protein
MMIINVGGCDGHDVNSTIRSVPNDTVVKRWSPMRGGSSYFL